MPYLEEDYLQLSGIQHFEFCRRQWALIHIEQLWEENYLTVSGDIMHERAHDKNLTEKRKDLIITRGMPIFSRELGISGECDVVEFKRDDKNGIELNGYEGKYNVIPVEYKHGEGIEADRIQLTAQVICLEEMLCCSIEYGYLYYGNTRHREKITITHEYRKRVADDVKEMHSYMERQYTPKVKPKKSCQSCSLKDRCVPKIAKTDSVIKYIKERIEEDDI